MSLLLSDGFSLYNSATLASKIKGWTASGIFTYLQAGRWGANSYSLLIGSATSSLSQTLATSGTTTILGMAFSATSSSTTTLAGITVNSNTILLEQVSTTGGFNLRVRNSTTSTTYTTSSAVYSTGAFYYVELKIIWAIGGAGRIILRVDNAVVYDSGATLTIVAANGSALLAIGASSASSLSKFTDLVFMDASGTSFNDLQGDVRIETLLPNADGANSGWTMPNNTILTSTNQSRLTTNATGWTTLSGTVSLSWAASGGPDTNKLPTYLAISTSTTTSSFISTPNGTSGYAVTAGQTLGFGAWIYSTPVPTPTVAARFYDSGGTQVGSDLSFGSFTASGSAWNFYNITTNTVTVPANAVTCAIIISFTSTVSSGFRMTGFVLSTNSTTPVYVDPSSPHYFELAEAIDDDDLSYVKSSTLNAKDTYAMTDSAASGTILAVRPLVVARKETSGPTRTIATMVRVGGSDYVSSNNQTVPSTLLYTPFTDTLTTNPATSAAWTKTDVNGMEAGFTITT